jgi:cytochrome c
LIGAAAFAEVVAQKGSNSMQRWGKAAIGSAAIGLTVICSTAIGFAGSAMAQDAAKGETVFKRCRACHAIGPNAQYKAGPPLNGIVGRKAAAVAGFDYSDAIKARAASGLVWTEGNLEAYLQAPDVFLPQGVMAFSGIKDPAQLKDLIAYLKTQK